jgi:hypothetical protein
VEASDSLSWQGWRCSQGPCRRSHAEDGQGLATRAKTGDDNTRRTHPFFVVPNHASATCNLVPGRCHAISRRHTAAPLLRRLPHLPPHRPLPRRHDIPRPPSLRRATPVPPPSHHRVASAGAHRAAFVRALALARRQQVRFRAAELLPLPHPRCTTTPSPRP